MALFRYEIQKGGENRTFSEAGIRNPGDGTLESDHELNSPYLKLIEDQPSTPPTPPNASVVASQDAPAAPVTPAAQNTAQDISKEADK